MSHLGLSNVKETLLIQDLKPALNEIVGSEKPSFSQLASYIIITCRLQIESVTSFVVIISRCLNFTVISLTVTSEDVCCDIRNIKSLKS